jgi:GTP-binding protein YchF
MTQIGIIGPPQSGKTVLLKALLQADVSGNVGIFRVLDHRVEDISRAYSSKKMTYPEFTFVDIGTTSDFGKKDLSQLSGIDLFICVIGAFFSEDPKRDFETCLTDIILVDIEVIQTKIERLKKEPRPEMERESKVLDKCQEHLSDGRFLWKAGLDKDEINLLSGLVFLSLKPLILAINVSEEKSEILENRIEVLEGYSRSKGISPIGFSGKIESEILELEPQEREDFLKALGINYNFREELAKMMLKELSLVTFFTTGEKETKGWFLKSGLNAIEAAGKIHSDMKRGFIRAEVVNYEDFAKYGSIYKCREAGVSKVEGRDYIVKDGDILNIRFNV